MAETVRRRGLDAQGFIEREGSLARVPDAFRPVVAAARDRIPDVFGPRLHSAYVYGRSRAAPRAWGAATWTS
ncbi:hypothetical protein GCM10010521_38260 [Streptomyces rameus]|uniref:Uncharacterized protein n=1 Tax=Streptomyces rameus TaxID=68261 RepID=A0ABP6NGJ9_9ACTN